MGRRKIIRINEELCDGCGECITACAEGALKLVDGKAKLVNEAFCDGFDRKIRPTKIPNRELLTDVIEQRLIGRALCLELSNQGAVGHVETLRHLAEARVIALAIEEPIEDPTSDVALLLPFHFGAFAEPYGLFESP